jgi:uncharacterized protein (DUF2237 family)
MSGFSVIYKNKRYTTDVSPSMTFMDIVKLFNRNPNNQRYLSMEFRDKISQVKNIQHLLNSKSITIPNIKSQNINSITKTKIIKVISNIDNNTYYYRLTLQRQYDFLNNIPLFDNQFRLYLKLYWRISSIKEIKEIKNTEKIGKVKSKMLGKNIKENFSNGEKNLNDLPLQICSTNPMTGYTRDGYCKLLPGDTGTHTVCAKMTDEFLEFTKTKGNDLTTPFPEHDFPGLKNDDKWCLCALRWKQAYEAGKAPKVDFNATNKETLKYVDIESLREHKL